MELLPLAFTRGWTSGVSAAAVLNPVAATVVVALLLVAGIWLSVTVLGRVRGGWLALRRWLQPA